MMSEQYLSAAELADMKLDILPSTRQAIDSKARREKWVEKFIIGKARAGKRKVFVVSSLPSDVQSAIKEKQAQQILENIKIVPQTSQVKKTSLEKKRLQQLGLSIDEEVSNLKDKQKDIAYARMSLCQEVSKMHHVAGLGVKEAVRYVIEQVDSGLLPEHLVKLIEVANARSNASRNLSFNTLYKWLRIYKAAKTPNERLAALSPRQTKPKTPLLAYDWLPEFMSFYSSPSNPSVIQAYRGFAKNWIGVGKDVAELPSIDAVRRALKKMPVIAKERGRKTGAAYKSLLPYVQRDWLALSPNDVWIGDGHSFKAKIAHPDHGRPFKPEVTVIVDCCRMIVGFSVSLAESTIAVADALRIGIKNFGLPLMYYSDNGGGQTGKMIDHEVTGYCARLGIHHETGMPGNPQGRGIIEGLWDGTLIALAKEYETYTGRGMDSSTKNMMYRKLESALNAENKGKELTPEQKRYKSKLPSWQQFIGDVARCIDVY
nr:DDE-type integrase/transposase/recombinase [Snodgrassella gandavensis]